MRGPSSSHTSASWRIGWVCRQVCGERITEARIRFDPGGSYARVYNHQGSDLAFAAGLMGWELTDDRFSDSLKLAADSGLRISFSCDKSLPDNHPNAVQLELKAVSGKEHNIRARSIGGGAIEIAQINGVKTLLKNELFETLIFARTTSSKFLMEELKDFESGTCTHLGQAHTGHELLLLAALKKMNGGLVDKIKTNEAVVDLITILPAAIPKTGQSLFTSTGSCIKIAQSQNFSLGSVAIRYEVEILGLTETQVMEEMARRYEIMKASVKTGLAPGASFRFLKHLQPSASKVYQRERDDELPIGGLHTRAASRALAVMHSNANMNVVCAAPTGGSAGTLPAVLVTLEEDLGIEQKVLIRALFAAGVVGLIFLYRGTFAAEMAGCQVEIGLSGAMASAAVIEAFGGSAQDATDAAAVSLQNTMGMVCDLVGGRVEIPCHTRNAIAASSAFVNADLILGGYRNPIPLDETIDASMEVGTSLKVEHRCTARGGLAITPSAQKLGN